MTSAGALTVADVLTLPCVDRGQPELLAGAGRLDTPVRWVHVLERLESPELLSGGELVLTTGLQLDRDPLATTDRLYDLQRAGVAGVVVELLASRDAARAALREAAARMDVPVVLLPQRIRFVEVTEQVHRRIVAAQLDSLERHREVHEVFTQASLDGASVADVVTTSARLLRRPVLLEDLAGRVLAYAGEDATDMLAAWEAASGTLAHSVEAGASADRRWWQAPVGVRGDVWGRLVTTGDGSGESLMVLERAAQTLAINRAAERDRSALAQQARAACLEGLRRSDLPEDDARVRAAAVGLHGAPAYVGLAVRVDARDSPEPAELQRRVGTVRDALEGVLGRRRVEGLLTVTRGELVQAVVALPGLDTVDDVVGGLARAMPDAPWLRGTHRRDDRAWWMGVGRPRSALTAAVAELDSAAHVADSAALAPSIGSRPFYRAADVRLRGLLSTYGEAAGGQAFVAAELGDLLDPARSGDLRLLELFCECGGNKAELARRAYVSRPTLYARLARIEADLGVPLDDAESRTSLHVALMLHRSR